MLANLADPVLPVFGVLLIGYLLARRSIIDSLQAQAMNRYVFYLGAPALVTIIIGNAPIDQINWPSVWVYFTVEVVLYAGVFALMRYAFRRPIGEALLLGMSASFANHILFVLPITERLYGDMAQLNMAGIVLMDAIIFTGTVLLTQLLASDQRGASKVAGLLLRNPFVYAPFAGLALGFFKETAPAGLWTFLDFSAAATAPVALFALGVTLAASNVTRIGGVCWSVVFAKLALHPVAVFAGLAATGTAAMSGAGHITLLVAAGPCGVMPFVIATQYGIRTETIAKVVLVSTILSVFSLSALT